MNIYPDPIDIKPIKLQQQNTQKTIYQVSLCIDGSGSMSKAFPYAKEVAKGIIRNFQKQGTQTAFSINIYNDKVHEVCNLLRDQNTLLERIDNAPYPGRDTDFLFPLEHSCNIFKNSPMEEENTECIVILITDGKTKNSEEVEQLCTKMKNEGILLVMVGVGGDINEYELKKCASYGCNYTYKTIHDLKKSVSNLVCSIQENEKVLKVQFYVTKIVDYGETAYLQVELYNNGAKSTIQNPSLHFQETAYFEGYIFRVKQDILPDETITVEVPLKTKGGVGMSQFVKNPSLQFYVTDQEKMRISTNYNIICLAAQMCMAKLARFVSVHGISALQLLITGLTGAGKSSFVNNLVKTVTHNENASVADVGSTQGPVTKALKTIDIEEICGALLETPIRIFDIWGKEMGTEQIPFTNSVLLKAIQGCLPHNFTPIANNLEKQLTSMCTVFPGQMVDYVIFVIEINMTTNPEVVKLMSDFCRFVTQENRQYAIIVSHSDALGESFQDVLQKDNPSRVKVVDNLESGQDSAMGSDRIFFTSSRPEKFVKGELWVNRVCRDLANYEPLLYIMANVDRDLKSMFLSDPSTRVRLGDTPVNHSGEEPRTEQSLAPPPPSYQESAAEARRFYFTMQSWKGTSIQLDIAPNLSDDELFQLVISHRRVKRSIPKDRLQDVVIKERDVEYYTVADLYKAESGGTKENPFEIALVSDDYPPASMYDGVETEK